MSSKSVVLMVIAVLGMVSARISVLDQHTDQSSAARDLLQGRMWQSFTPGWEGNVLQLDVYIGSSQPCRAHTGRLVVRYNLPTSYDSFSSNDTLSEQTITTTCEGAICSNGDCMQWHNYTLPSPIPVTADTILSFALLDLAPLQQDSPTAGDGSSTTTTTTTAPDTGLAESVVRVGVSPSALNHGGPASLLVSPKFKTQYTQYAFRSWMDRTSDGSTELEQRPGDNDITSPERSGDGSSSASNLPHIIVPVVIILCFAVLVVVFVRVRSSLRKDTHLSALVTDSSKDDTVSVRTAWSEHSENKSFEYNPKTINVESLELSDDMTKKNSRDFESGKMSSPSKASRQRRKTYKSSPSRYHVSEMDETNMDVNDDLAFFKRNVIRSDLHLADPQADAISVSSNRSAASSATNFSFDLENSYLRPDEISLHPNAFTDESEL